MKPRNKEQRSKLKNEIVEIACKSKQFNPVLVKMIVDNDVTFYDRTLLSIYDLVKIIALEMKNEFAQKNINKYEPQIIEIDEFLIDLKLKTFPSINNLKREYLDCLRMVTTLGCGLLKEGDEKSDDDNLSKE